MQPGDVVGRRFRLESLAGAGGMAAVFRARDLYSRQLVALKLTFGHRSGDARRIAREAQILERCDHPTVVRLVAHGDDGGLGYLAVEWLEGESLAARLGRSGLSLQDSLWLAARAARALGAVHALGVVHCDVTTANLFLVGDGVKLIDFGIAAEAATDEDARCSSRWGTAQYACPERVEGSGKPDPRWDVYGLGAVLFECLTGTVPYQGDTLVDVLTRKRLEDPPPPSSLRREIPRAVDRAVLRLLARDPALRPGSGDAAADELEHLAAEVQSRVPAPVRHAPPLLADEARIVTLAVAGQPVSPSSKVANTVRIEELRRRAGVDRALAVCEPFGVHADYLPDVGTVLLADERLNGLEQAAAVARSALALAGEPGRGVGVATRRASSRASWAIGDALEEAHRLVLRASGRVLCDAVTKELLSAGFSFEAAGDDYRMTGQVAALTAEARTELAPFVGRERELALLRDLYTRVARARSPHAAIVLGEPGIGKSRLAAQLRTMLADFPDVAVHAVRAVPIGTGSPFFVVAKVIRAAIGLDESDPSSVRRQALETRLRALGLHGVGETALHLGAILAVSSSRDLAPDSTTMVRREFSADHAREALCRWLRAEAGARAGLVVVIDDLQWGDFSSVRLLERSLLECAGCPLFLVAVARPQLLEEFPGMWAGPTTTTIELEGLDEDAAIAIARHHLGAPGTADSAAVRRVVSLAHGNPFHLEALAGGAARGTEDVPETVLTLVQAQLDQLDPKARLVLRVASVFGDAFTADDLAALLGPWHRASLDAWLARLEEEAILERRRPRADGAHYAFRHELWRQAAYATLVVEDRRSAHRLVAGWLELRGDVTAVRLAEHWSHGGNGAKAAELYHRAAMQALGGHDFAGTLKFVERAVHCGAEGGLLGSLRLLEADVREWSADSAARERAAERAIELLDPGSNDWFAAFEHALVACARQRGAAATATLAEVLDALTAERSPSEGEARALARAGGLLLMLGRLPRGTELLERAWSVARSLPSKTPTLDAWLEWGEAWRAYAAGDLAEALRRDVAACHAFERAGDVRNTCYAYSNVGYEQLRLGLLEEAEHSFRAALELGERLGLHWLAGTAANNLGLVLAFLGQHDAALASERRALELAKRIDLARLEVSAHLYLARIHLVAGRADAAEREARIAHGIAGSSPALRSRARASLAFALLMQGRAREALAEARLATDPLPGDLEPDADVPYASLAHAEAALAVGLAAEARRALELGHDELRATLARIGNAHLRQSFLTRVPENARICALRAHPTQRG
jgi:eukaryotic-like serine/threonine-protein kinase